MIAKKLKLEGSAYYKKHLEIINPFLPIRLTQKQIEVLGEFMALPDIIRFTSLGRKKVREALSMTHAALSNHIQALIKSGFIIELDRVYTIPPVLIPDNKHQGYNFLIVNKDGN